jgi:hypothetical protein
MPEMQVHVLPTPQNFVRMQKKIAAQNAANSRIKLTNGDRK